MGTVFAHRALPASVNRALDTHHKGSYGKMLRMKFFISLFVNVFCSSKGFWINFCFFRYSLLWYYKGNI